mmetsp:Transcript_22740/g.65564  ORF Transcript_22740/g.65564 Transcript_22740/m.65564 type:complete len:244 (+) Transcript_22740:311-1042(+)
MCLEALCHCWQDFHDLPSDVLCEPPVGEGLAENLCKSWAPQVHEAVSLVFLCPEVGGQVEEVKSAFESLLHHLIQKLLGRVAVGDVAEHQRCDACWPLLQLWRGPGSAVACACGLGRAGAVVVLGDFRSKRFVAEVRGLAASAMLWTWSGLARHGVLAAVTAARTTCCPGGPRSRPRGLADRRRLTLREVCGECYRQVRVGRQRRGVPSLERGRDRLITSSGNAAEIVGGIGCSNACWIRAVG